MGDDTRSFSRAKKITGVLIAAELIFLVIAGIIFAIVKMLNTGIVHILQFIILFLIPFCIWQLLVNTLRAKKQHILAEIYKEPDGEWENRSPFFLMGCTAVSLALNIVFFIYTLWFITSMFASDLLGILILILLAGIALWFMLWEAFGEPSKKWHTISEISLLDPSKPGEKISLGQSVFIFLNMTPYLLNGILPFVVFYLFFVNPATSKHLLTFLILAYMIMFSSYFPTLVTTIRSFMSGNVDAKTQFRIFLNSLPQHLLFALVYLLPFLGLVSSSYTDELRSQFQAQTNLPFVLIIIMVFFLALVMFPFYIGSTGQGTGNESCSGSGWGGRKNSCISSKPPSGTDTPGSWMLSHRKSIKRERTVSGEMFLQTGMHRATPIMPYGNCSILSCRAWHS